MAVQITNTLTAVITATEDATSLVPINRGTGNPSVDSTSALFVEQFKLGGIGVDSAIPVPAATCDQVYIKNNDATAQVTVKWAVQGGGVQTVAVLKPSGGQIILWQVAAGQGVGSITCASTVAGSFIEVFTGAI